MIVRVGSLSAESGEKVHGYVEAAEKPLGKVKLPVTIINGEKGDKVLFVMAGIHAVEYPGIRAAQRLAQEITPSQVTGAIIILHCANPQMFNARTPYVNPVDGVNFNRIFPGEPTFKGFYGPGTISHHITNFIYREMMQKATHFMDLHSGDMPEVLPFYVGGASTGDKEKDKEIYQMLRYTLADFIVMYPKSTSLSTTGASSRLGIPNIIVEAGGAGQNRLDDVQKHFDAVVNVAKYLGVVDGEPVEPGEQREFNGVTTGIRARRGGFFTCLVDPGEVIETGQILGSITDSFGVILEEVKSPIDGVVQIIHYPAAKHTGDPLFSLQGLK